MDWAEIVLGFLWGLWDFSAPVAILVWGFLILGVIAPFCRGRIVTHPQTVFPEPDVPEVIVEEHHHHHYHVIVTDPSAVTESSTVQGHIERIAPAEIERSRTQSLDAPRVVEGFVVPAPGEREHRG